MIGWELLETVTVAEIEKEQERIEVELRSLRSQKEFMQSLLDLKKVLTYQKGRR